MAHLCWVNKEATPDISVYDDPDVAWRQSNMWKAHGNTRGSFSKLTSAIAQSGSKIAAYWSFAISRTSKSSTL